MVVEAYAAEVVAGVAVSGLDAVAARDGAAAAGALDELVLAGLGGGSDDAGCEGHDGKNDSGATHG